MMIDSMRVEVVCVSSSIASQARQFQYPLQAIRSSRQLFAMESAIEQPGLTDDEKMELLVDDPKITREKAPLSPSSRRPPFLA